MAVYEEGLFDLRGGKGRGPPNPAISDESLCVHTYI